jgi:hypothetical protein
MQLQFRYYCVFVIDNFEGRTSKNQVLLSVIIGWLVGDVAFGHRDGDRFDKVPQPISTTVPWNKCKKSSMIASNVISQSVFL